MLAVSATSIHVLLPVHNRRDITRRCIEQLLRQRYPDIHIVVIDDGSTDGTSDIVASLAPRATILRGDGTWWWAGSLQRGLDWLASERAGGDDIVLILNDDTEFGDEFVEHAVKRLQGESGVMLLAQAHSTHSGKAVEVGVRVDWKAFRFDPVGDIEQANCLSTRGLFMRFRDAQAVGGFFPRLLPHYLSDYEFTMRGRRRGLRLVTDPLVKLTVNEEATGERHSEKSSPGRFLRSVFTKRSVPNPFYWSSFVLLACPARWIPLNLHRIWRGFMQEFRQSLRGRQA